MVLHDPALERAKEKVFIEFRPDLEPFCFGCGIYREVKISACKLCMIAMYCSKNCQKKDWGEHKVECKMVCDSIVHCSKYSVV